MAAVLGRVTWTPMSSGQQKQTLAGRMVARLLEHILQESLGWSGGLARCLGLARALHPADPPHSQEHQTANTTTEKAGANYRNYRKVELKPWKDCSAQVQDHASGRQLSLLSAAQRKYCRTHRNEWG